MEIDAELDEIQKFAMFWADYGQQLVMALVVLVVGIIIIQRGGPLIEKACLKFGVSQRVTREIVTGFYVLLGVILLGFILRHLGVSGPIVRQLLMAGGLIAAAVLLLLRPYLPKLPFKVGNLVKTGEVLGKVEHTSLLNTRLKTFDGLIIMVPNAKIVNDYVVNYHSTPNRRIRLNLAIRYNQDIVEAKRIVEAIMVQDPRTLPTPRPVVYVTELADSWVELGGRAWVKNPKAWVTRCDILEKIRYEFNQQGIEVAFVQQDLHIYSDKPDVKPNPGDPDEVVTSMLSSVAIPGEAQFVPRGNE